ncbi:MAG: YggU family protein [Chloroflexi bacterium]|nr:YggU family protein [Chloroflexota bacterium]
MDVKEAAIARISVHVQPNAKRSEVVGMAEGIFRVRIAAPPSEGRANEALLAFLADALGVKRRDVSLVRGASSREKVVEVAGLDAETIRERLLQGRP